jgi:hypothetical protein
VEQDMVDSSDDNEIKRVPGEKLHCLVNIPGHQPAARFGEIFLYPKDKFHIVFQQ